MKRSILCGLVSLLVLSGFSREAVATVLTVRYRSITDNKEIAPHMEIRASGTVELKVTAHPIAGYGFKFWHVGGSLTKDTSVTATADQGANVTTAWYLADAEDKGVGSIRCFAYSMHHALMLQDKPIEEVLDQNGKAVPSSTWKAGSGTIITSAGAAITDLTIRSKRTVDIVKDIAGNYLPSKTVWIPALGIFDVGRFENWTAVIQGSYTNVNGRDVNVGQSARGILVAAYRKERTPSDREWIPVFDWPPRPLVVFPPGPLPPEDLAVQIQKTFQALPLEDRRNLLKQVKSRIEHLLRVKETLESEKGTRASDRKNEP